MNYQVLETKSLVPEVKWKRVQYSDVAIEVTITIEIALTQNRPIFALLLGFIDHPNRSSRAYFSLSMRDDEFIDKAFECFKAAGITPISTTSETITKAYFGTAHELARAAKALRRRVEQVGKKLEKAHAAAERKLAAKRKREENLVNGLTKALEKVGLSAKTIIDL